jgi:hypothetical protein
MIGFALCSPAHRFAPVSPCGKCFDPPKQASGSKGLSVKPRIGEAGAAAVG